MAKPLAGAPVAAALIEAAAREASALFERGVLPTLAILRLGERPSDIAYERGATGRCEKAGIRVRRIPLPADAPQARLIAEIEALNGDLGVHGILILRPLPKAMDDNAVRNAVSPEKDIDGITDAALARVFTGAGAGYAPCTAQACMEILDYYGIDPTGKRAVVIGRSLVVGRPVAMMLLARHATVTLCHTRTTRMPAICRDAELLIVSAGKAHAVGGDCLSPGQVVIDVGVNADASGALCGDVRFEDAEGIDLAITPVPGGVGAVTTAVLAKHVIAAAGEAARNRFQGSPEP
ncbi:MAG: bifunctional 5,10-methylenetetrahydrofolate dehydrogenase/5,10-methenyltetrahydrofolate cyclohydrolase [Clostridiales Family XIII bacterium]|jgi:methylenetetrahydrofolate dehydrogenase (NADP+)/methenyltetrahydrofolate cyclohydrolase|nr:bifunctional 5,10-methylenetetrahydrofolate dehydrogenase/5,10-methenyltetrahydrofolate cyclohydrolase [Clostridiales Family XIII bacterium]